MTYSIVARDPITGHLGVGVETHQPAVGAIVPWVKAGVGAVATQSFANIHFGPRSLALLESGLSAEQTLAAILAADTMAELRQVSVLAADGTSATHTGARCIPFAGHIQGEDFSAQANMMTRPGVPEAMAEAFAATEGPLPLRILATLDAAQAAGGDIRGQQSAAILVRGPGPLDYTWDLRVDNSRAPLEDLRALVNMRLAAHVLPEEGMTGSYDEAIAAFHRARELDPTDEPIFWFALGRLVELGRLDEAAALLRPLFERAPQWEELLRRLELPGARQMREHLGL